MNICNPVPIRCTTKNLPHAARTMKCGEEFLWYKPVVSILKTWMKEGLWSKKSLNRNEKFHQLFKIFFNNFLEGEVSCWFVGF